MEKSVVEKIHKVCGSIEPGRQVAVVVPTELVSGTVFARVLADNGLKVAPKGVLSGRVKPPFGEETVVQNMVVIAFDSNRKYLVSKLAALCGVAVIFCDASEIDNGDVV